MPAAVSNLSGSTICLKVRVGNPPERPELFFLRLATHKAQHGTHLHNACNTAQGFVPSAQDQANQVIKGPVIASVKSSHWIFRNIHFPSGEKQIPAISLSPSFMTLRAK